MKLARISHRFPTAAAPGHALHDVHSVEVLDVLSSTPARSSVANAAHDAPWNALATENGEICGLIRVPLLLSLALLTACAGLPQPRQTPAPVEDSRPVVIVPATPVPSPESSGPSVRAPEAPAPVPAPATPSSSLLASVDAAIAAGELEQAAALCERALRISPRDGMLWYRLASIRFQQERYADATGFAQRALSFAGSDPALARSARNLVERAEALQATLR